MKGSIKSSRAKCRRAHSDSSQVSCNHDASAANEGAGGREERVAMAMATGRGRGRARKVAQHWGVVEVFSASKVVVPRVCECGCAAGTQTFDL